MGASLISCFGPTVMYEAIDSKFVNLGTIFQRLATSYLEQPSNALKRDSGFLEHGGTVLNDAEHIVEALSTHLNTCRSLLPPNISDDLSAFRNALSMCSNDNQQHNLGLPWDQVLTKLSHAVQDLVEKLSRPTVPPQQAPIHRFSGSSACDQSTESSSS
ncbi:hypothetical protein GY45DRAFT_518947 [Cubamyces sp. BRFM 1775]|nr:hypothetical protein GY45DRAFT_518947 [Cubamyces sp. BRFM 1775]